MQYHIVLFPTGSDVEMTAEERREIKETNQFIQNMCEKNKSHADCNNKGKKATHVLYIGLQDETAMHTLAGGLKAGDELVIHADGNPFVMGPRASSKYDLYAMDFAKQVVMFLKKVLSQPGNQVLINLLVCNSATTFIWEAENRAVNFAQDLSRALVALGCPEVVVRGYTGFLKVQSNGKCSVYAYQDTDDAKQIANNGHGSFQDCSIDYQRGQETKKQVGQVRRVLSILPSTRDYWGSKKLSEVRAGYLARQKELVDVVLQEREQLFMQEAEARQAIMDSAHLRFFSAEQPCENSNKEIAALNNKQ